jgi:Undecaprenyl-phosphate galactose phosphotransferase WbaP
MLTGEINRSLLKTITVICLLIIDSLALITAFFISVEVRLMILPKIFHFFPGDFPLTFTTHLWWMLVLCLGCLAYAGLYTKRLPFWPETRNIYIGVSLAFILIMAVVSLAKLSGDISRTAIVISFLLALVIMPVFRYAGKTLLFNMGIWAEKVLIVGLNKSAIQVAEAMQSDKYLGYRLAGFLTGPMEQNISNKVNYEILGSYDNAVEIIESSNIRHVVIAAPHLSGSQLVELSNHLQPYTRSVLVVPDLFGLPVVNGEADYFFDEQILALRIKNNLSSPTNILVKRVFDLLVALLLFIPLLILILLLAVLIKIDSPGPVFHAGNRIGRQGREFKCYKFRTMFMNNDKVLQNYLKNNPQAREEWHKFYKLKGEDPRITKIGCYLRKTSMDELPQIINVIKGEMSLVGARPYLPEEKEAMGVYADTILLANPGITGLWQVSGRNEIDFAGRLNMETWYVRNWSLWLDVSLLLRTVSVVFNRRGAY